MKNTKKILGWVSVAAGIAILALIIVISAGKNNQDSLSAADSVNKDDQGVSSGLGSESAIAAEYDQILIKVGESGGGAGSHKDGDIVVIKGDDQKWGRMEKIKFLIVRVPKLTDEEKAEFAAADEDGLRLYGIDYTKFLTDDEVIMLRRKTAAFTLSRGANADNAFYLTTGEQYPVIGKDDIVKKEAGAESAIPDEKRLTEDKI